MESFSPMPCESIPEEDESNYPPDPERKLVCYGHEEMVEIARGLRKREIPIHIVPTMGNMHRYHEKMIEEAKKARTDGKTGEMQPKPCVIVVIYAHEKFFKTKQEFDRWPKHRVLDHAYCHDLKVNAVFLPDETEIHTRDYSCKTPEFEMKPPARLLNIPERMQEPGIITAKLTFLLKMANLFRPNGVFLPIKDYQFYIIAKHMFHYYKTACDIFSVPIEYECRNIPISNHMPPLPNIDVITGSNIHIFMQMAYVILQQNDREWVTQAINPNQPGRLQILNLDKFTAMVKSWHDTYMAIDNIKLTLRCAVDLSPLVIIKDQRLIDCHYGCLRRKYGDRNDNLRLPPHTYLPSRLFIVGEWKNEKFYDNCDIMMNKGHWGEAPPPDHMMIFRFA